MAIPSLTPTKKKPAPEEEQAKLSLGTPKAAGQAAAVKPPQLTGQSAPPPPNTSTVDPVTGARSTPNGAPQPVAGQPVAPPGPGIQQPNTPTSGPLTGPVADRGNAAANRDVTDISTDSLDAQLRAMIAKRIEGASNVDTSSEEALIQDLMQRQLGEQLVGQRASMGRSGFAGIGAMEGDLQRQAALDAQREILGLRRTEDQRAFDNALNAAGTDLDFRKFGSEDEIARAKLKALQDYLGLPMDEVGGGEGGPLSNSVDELFFGANNESPVATGSGYSTDDPIVVSTPPQGAQPISKNNRGTYYQGSNGRIYLVEG